MLDRGRQTSLGLGVIGSRVLCRHIVDRSLLYCIGEVSMVMRRMTGVADRSGQASPARIEAVPRPALRSDTQRSACRGQSPRQTG